MGYKFTIMATVDIQLAIYRRSAYSARKRLLYTIHRNESLHYVWYGNCSFLRTGNRNVRFILANMERNGEKTKRFTKFTSRKER